MNSFNVYGQTEQKVGGNTPIWLGTVKPIPVGGTIDGPVSGDTFSAGSLVDYDASTKTITSIFSAVEPEEIETANGYLYNDIIISDDITGVGVTAAVVMHHPEGLLIERVYPEITEEQIAQLQAKIPGVLLVRG